MRIQVDRQVDRQLDQTGSQTDRQTDMGPMQINKQADRSINRQTEREMGTGKQTVGPSLQRNMCFGCHANKSVSEALWIRVQAGCPGDLGVLSPLATGQLHQIRLEKQTSRQTCQTHHSPTDGLIRPKY